MRDPMRPLGPVTKILSILFFIIFLILTGLYIFPPVGVVFVPINSKLKRVVKIVLRLPSEGFMNFSPVYRIASVVSGTVFDVLDHIFFFFHYGKNFFDNFKI